MRIGAIVQARMSSHRLPGKSLRPLCGKPMLQYVLENLRQVGGLAGPIVATSIDRSDDPIAEFCERFDYTCFRGPLDDVAARFLQAATEHGLDAFVRLSGDSPLLDWRLVTRIVALFLESGPDLATNVFPRTFPAGMSVEVVGTAVLEGTASEMSEALDREHVTRFFYRHPDRFRIENLEHKPERRDVHLAADTPEQFDYLERIVRLLRRPHWEYSLEDVLGLWDQVRP